MENPIKDNRIVNDRTFATRFKSHLEGMRASCAAADEEIQYLKKVADKLLKYQLHTSPDSEIPYHSNCNNIKTVYNIEEAKYHFLTSNKTVICEDNGLMVKYSTLYDCNKFFTRNEIAGNTKVNVIYK